MALLHADIETDIELFDRVKRLDDRQAFKILYQRHWKTLFNAATLRIPSVEIAEEIVQNVFVDLYRKREQLTIDSSLEAYLKTAIKFQVFKTFRQQRIREEYLLNMQVLSSEKSEGPDVILEGKQLKEQVLLLAEKLPKTCGEVFLLSRIEQLSNQEISLKLDISLSMVRKHITKSMNFMRTNFHKQKMDVLKVVLLYFLLN